MRHRHLLFGDAQGGFAANPTLRSKFTFYADPDDGDPPLVDSVAGNNLTNNGAVTFVAGGTPAGYSNYVAASLQFLSRATFGAVEPVLDQSYCMAAWVYLDALTSNMPIAGKWRPSNFEYLMQLNGTSQMRFLVRNSANSANLIATSPTTLTTGTWNFFVAGFDASASQVYISTNGGARTNTAGSPRIGGTADFRIGHSDGAIYMDGRITRVGFGRFVPTAAEITHLFNAGAGRLYSEITI